LAVGKEQLAKHSWQNMSIQLLKVGLVRNDESKEQLAKGK